MALSLRLCWCLGCRRFERGDSHDQKIQDTLNRTVRHEWLDQHLFSSIHHAQQTATEWLWQYNNQRPNLALGGITPSQKLEAA